MNFPLLKNFMLEFLPDDAQLVLNEVLNALEEQPLILLNNSLLWNHTRYFKGDDKKLAICAANGMVLGFALAYAVHKYPAIEKELEAYIADSAKRRGENVVNFLQKKGKSL